MRFLRVTRAVASEKVSAHVDAVLEYYVAVYSSVSSLRIVRVWPSAPLQTYAHLYNMGSSTLPICCPEEGVNIAWEGSGMGPSSYSPNALLSGMASLDNSRENFKLPHQLLARAPAPEMDMIILVEGLYVGCPSVRTSVISS